MRKIAQFKAFRTVSFTVLLIVGLATSGRETVSSQGQTPTSKPTVLPRAGSSGGARLNERTIAVVPKSLDNPIFIDAKVAAIAEGNKLGVNVDWVGPYSTNTQEQIRIMRWLISKHVAGILVSCNDPKALEPVIDEGIAAGVKIATFDSDSPGSRRLFYVGTDNTALGSAAAESLLHILAKRKMLAHAAKQKPLTAVIVSGRRQAYNLDQRILAFKKTMAGHANITYLPTLYANDSISRTIDLTDNATREDPNLNVIFFTGGWLFYAPIESMKDYSRWIKNGGIAVTIDATYPVLRAEQRNLVQAVAGQDFKEMGRLGVELLVRAIHGKSVPKVVHTRISVVTPANVTSLLKTTKNYEIQ